MRKIISKILILVILINFIMPKFSFATEAQEGEYNGAAGVMEGAVKVGNVIQPIDYKLNTGEAIASLLVTVPSAICAIIKGTLSSVINEGDMSEQTNFTIGELISGDYNILNNDFLLESNDSPANNSIKEAVSGWYYGIRNLAIIISLLVLVYIGIRMAISTLSDDKAKYKKMLVSWIQSFILIFFLHYIMIIAMGLQRVLMNVIPRVDGQAEREICGMCWKMIWVSHGWNILWFGILYWVLTYYQVKFFFLYAKRMISTAFLMVIAPLITVTYSIDKVSDNKAQAFGAWLKEFVVNIFIQPVHIVVYLIFITSASELAIKVPLLMIVFLGALSRGEKIIKGLFGMRGLKSINSMGKKKK